MNIPTLQRCSKQIQILKVLRTAKWKIIDFSIKNPLWYAEASSCGLQSLPSRNEYSTAKDPSRIRVLSRELTVFHLLQFILSYPLTSWNISHFPIALPPSVNFVLPKKINIRWLLQKEAFRNLGWVRRLRGARLTISNISWPGRMSVMRFDEFCARIRKWKVWRASIVSRKSWETDLSCRVRWNSGEFSGNLE